MYYPNLFGDPPPDPIDIQQETSSIYVKVAHVCFLEIIS
jgi:hypothetical protein